MNDTPNGPHQTLENPIPYLTADANRALVAARLAEGDGRVDDEASFSRIAMLLYFSALRGLVNFLYEWTGVPNHEWRAFNVAHRWSNAVELCLPRLEQPGEALAFPRDNVGDDLPLLERFLELKDAVNDLVHDDAPYGAIPVETTPGVFEAAATFPHTGLPRRQSEYRRAHAESAASVYDAMVARLDLCTRGKVAELRTSDGNLLRPMLPNNIASDPPI